MHLLRALLLAALATGAGTLRADDPVPPLPTDFAPALAHPESLDGWRPVETLSEAWPFPRPSLETLHAAPRKVFAHFFTPFPLSYDNKPPEADTYAVQELSPTGEGGKYAKAGGYLRQRPLVAGPWDSPVWQRRNLAAEIVRARELGLDGFVLDLMTPSGRLWEANLRLLDTAHEVAPDFKIVLMADMNTVFKSHPDWLEICVANLADNPAVYRLDDGRLVLSVFDAAQQKPEWWAALLARLKARGIDVAFYPLFLGVDPKSYAPIAYGVADWGPRTIPQLAAFGSCLKAFAMVPHFMMAVAPQDLRPKDGWYREGRNTTLFRSLWEEVIPSKLDWVQLVTWNDYSEASEISPSSGTQYLFYDLSAYYLIWYKTGTPPPIERDALYYCHRSQILPLKPPPTDQVPFRSFTGETSNLVELVAFLKTPGTLEIRIGDQIFHRDAPAGLTAFSVPASPGMPVFRLLRDGEEQIRLQSAWPIVTTAALEDPLYRGGSSNRPFFTTQSPITGTSAP